VITIVKSSLDEIHDTIKTMLSYALALSDSQVPTVYELGYYLADNILAKICLAVAIEKGEEQQTYTTTSHGNRTKNFFNLYNDHLKQHYPQAPNYDPDIKDFHEERNVYQHDVESFDMTMRQPRVRSYVNIVELIMRMAGILKIGETIQPQNLTSSGRSYKYSMIQSRALKVKYQRLHDLLRVQGDADILIKIKNQLDLITINQLKKILSMQSSSSSVSHITMWNSRFQIFYMPSIGGDHFTIERKGQNKASYTPIAPHENPDVLDDFLQYYRDCFREHGININP